MVIFSAIKVCRNGKCTAELENIIPDYTHVTQTISRAPSQDRILSRSDTFTPASNSPRSPRQFSRTLTSRTGPLRSVYQENSSPLPDSPGQSLDGQSNCRDIVNKLAGSLSCSEFLEKFGYRYCNHNYIKRNCCASQAIVCNTTDD